MNSITVGIASIGYYIPSKILKSESMAQQCNIPVSVLTEKIGMKQKHIASEYESPSYMAIKASLDAIEKAGIQPESIDLIVYCGAGDYDYRFWCPSAKIQSEIGAKNAFAFELRNGCNGANLGIHVCRSLLKSDPNLSCGLVICSDNLHSLINYSDTDSISLFIFADAAAAAVLKKREPTNEILSYYAITNGQLADELKAPLGGTKFPYFGKNMYVTDNKIKILDREKLSEIFDEIYLTNYLQAITRAVHNSGYSIQDIDFLFNNQIKKNLSNQIISSLGLTEKQTLRTLPEYGHMGPVDTLFCLAKTLEKKKIKPGNLVVLASSTFGFSWGGIVLKYN